MLREKLRKYLPKLPGDVLKIFVILLFVFPFYWMGSTAFKTYQEAIRTPPTLIPEVFTLGNLKEIFTGADNILRYACNSLIITASVVVILVLVMVPAAYAFATREFPFKKALFGIVLVAFMIPEQITYISVYLMFSVIGIWNSYFWPLVMTNSDKFRPLTLYVEKLKQDAEQGLQWNLIMAGNLILVVPILIIYCFGSKQIIKAFTYNGIK